MASARTSVPSTSTCTRCPGRRSSSSEPSRAAAPNDSRTPSSSSTSPEDESGENAETVACTESTWSVVVPVQLCPGCDVGAAPPESLGAASSAAVPRDWADAGVSCFAGSVCGLAVGVDFLAGDLAAGDLAAGDVAAGDLAAGDLAAGDFLAGDVAAGAFFAGALSSDELAVGGFSVGVFSTGVSVE